MKFKEILHMYAIGAIGYSFVEILWRGRTHWSMGIAGGICLVFMYFLNTKFEKMNILIKSLISALFVTFVELVIGIAVNMLLDMNVWDYSQMRFNFLGQISLLYSFFWYVLCIPCFLLCKLLRHRVFGVLSSKNF